MEKESALKYEKLQKRLKEMGRLVVSFSGGVDSTFLLAVAREVIGDQVTAVTAAGRSVPEWEDVYKRQYWSMGILFFGIAAAACGSGGKQE